MTNTISQLSESISALVDLEPGPADLAQTRYLLDDFAICAASCRAPGGRSGRVDEPTDAYALAQTLARAAHHNDLDDVHYQTLIHVGGIVWPALLASARPDATLEEILPYAWHGYSTAVCLAMEFGAALPNSFHRSAVFSTVGGAVSVALALGRRKDGAIEAASHAASVSPALSQSVVEKSTTAAFHREVAAVNAVMAGGARFRHGSPVQSVLEGTLGLVGSPMQSPPDTLAINAVGDVVVRTHWTSGFGQIAAHAAGGLKKIDLGRITTFDLRASEVVASMAHESTVTNEHEAWWSLAYAIAASLDVADRPIDGLSSSRRDAASRARLTWIPDPVPGGIRVEFRIVLDDGSILTGRAAASDLPSASDLNRHALMAKAELLDVSSIVRRMIGPTSESDALTVGEFIRRVVDSEC